MSDKLQLVDLIINNSSPWFTIAPAISVIHVYLWLIFSARDKLKFIGH